MPRVAEAAEATWQGVPEREARRRCIRIAAVPRLSAATFFGLAARTRCRSSSDQMISGWTCVPPLPADCDGAHCDGLGSPAGTARGRCKRDGDKDSFWTAACAEMLPGVGGQRRESQDKNQACTKQNAIYHRIDQNGNLRPRRGFPCHG